MYENEDKKTRTDLAEALLRKGDKKNIEIAELTNLDAATITRIKNHIALADATASYGDEGLNEWLKLRNRRLNLLKPYIEVLEYEDYLKIKEDFEKINLKDASNFKKVVESLVNVKYPSFKPKNENSYIKTDFMPSNAKEEYVMQLNRDGVVPNKDILFDAFAFSREINFLKPTIEAHKNQRVFKRIVDLLKINVPTEKVQKLINLEESKGRKVVEYREAQMEYLKEKDINLNLFLISELNVESFANLSDDIKLHLYATVDYLHLVNHKGHFLDKNVSNGFIEYLNGIDYVEKVETFSSDKEEDVPHWHLKVSIDSYTRKLINFIDEYSSNSLYKNDVVAYPKSMTARYIPLPSSYSKKEKILIDLNNLKLNSLEKEDSLKFLFSSLRESKEDLMENYILPSKKKKTYKIPSSNWYKRALKEIFNVLISDKALIDTEYKIKELETYVDIVSIHNNELVFYCIYDSYDDYKNRYSQKFKNIADKVYIVCNFSKYLVSKETTHSNVSSVDFDFARKKLNYSDNEGTEKCAVNKSKNKKVTNDIISKYNQMLLDKLQ